MGLAVLPARLKTEIALLADAVLQGKNIESDETLSKHADWANDIISRHNDLNRDNIDEILKEEIGIVFGKVLEHAGVYKRNSEGMAAFLRFIDSVNN